MSKAVCNFCFGDENPHPGPRTSSVCDIQSTPKIKLIMKSCIFTFIGLIPHWMKMNLFATVKVDVWGYEYFMTTEVSVVADTPFELHCGPLRPLSAEKWLSLLHAWYIPPYVMADCQTMLIGSKVVLRFHHNHCDMLRDSNISRGVWGGTEAVRGEAVSFFPPCDVGLSVFLWIKREWYQVGKYIKQNVNTWWLQWRLNW